MFTIPIKLIDTPIKYSESDPHTRRLARKQYAINQDRKCWYCGELLDDEPKRCVRDKKLNMDLFPDDFLNHPIHLHHDHETDLTIGAVHAYCNGVLWQYEGK